MSNRLLLFLFFLNLIVVIWHQYLTYNRFVWYSYFALLLILLLGAVWLPAAVIIMIPVTILNIFNLAQKKGVFARYG